MNFIIRYRRCWVDNIERNASDLRLEETRTDRAIDMVRDRVQWKGKVVAALSSRARCGH